jgi:hypothetical protein
MRKAKQKGRLLADAVGFTLNEAARILGNELGEQPQHIARALWRELKAGLFDPPSEWLLFPDDRLIDPNVPEAEKPKYKYGCSLMSDDKFTSKGIYSRSVEVLFGNEMQVGEEGDFGDSVFVPREALSRFCDHRQITCPTFLKPQRVVSRSSVSEEEIYEFLTSHGEPRIYRVDELVELVQTHLDKTITRATRAFQGAYRRAKKAEIIRIAPRGRPTKA